MTVTNASAAGGVASNISEEDRYMAIAACLSVFVVSVFGPLVIYFMKRSDSKFVAYYAALSMLTSLGSFLVILIGYLSVLAGIFWSGALSLLVMAAGGILMLAGLGLCVLFIMGAIRAYGGKMLEVPVVSGIARRFA